MLKVNGLVKNYGDFTLNCTMKVEPGRITGLVGENGAGKTTLFKSVLGLTPSQYFEQYRLSLSVSLLLNTRESIIDISGKCGFQSPSYFTKVFHKRYGLTPTEFRASQAAPPASS